MLTSVVLYRAMMATSPAQIPVIGRRQPPVDPFEYFSDQDSFEHVVSSLKKQEFLPGETHSDLLLALPALQEALKMEVLQKQLTVYKQLNWFQKLFFDQSELENADSKQIPFSELEKDYPDKAERMQLFCALCELHERRLIHLDTTHPLRVSLTPQGEKAIQILKKYVQPPAYDGIKLPQYEPKL